MRTIICGMGEVGRHLARDFVEAGHDVVALDSSAEALTEVETSLDVLTLRGHAALPRTLEQAEAGRADLVVAVTDHDETNLVAALAARQLGATQTIARLGNRDYYPDSRGWCEGLLDVDLALCPGLLAGAEVTRLSRACAAHYVENFAGNLVQVMVQPVGEDSEAAGKPAARLALPRACRVLAVVRDGVSQPPEDIARLQPEDLVVAAGPTEGLHELDALFVVGGRRRGRAIVVGGGEMGRSVALQLRPIVAGVTLADRSRATCDALAANLTGVRIEHGDGTNLPFLEEIDTQNARTFVSTTHQDEVNLMGTLLAKRLGVERAIALLHRPDYAGVYSALGIDDTVSPRLLVGREVMRFVTRHSGALVSPLPEDGSAVVETQLPASSPLVGRRAFDLDLPHGARLAAIVRGTSLLEEPDLTPLAAGDVVVAYAPERAIARVRGLLARR